VLLDGDFVYTDQTIANSVKAAKSNRFQINLVGVYLPILAGILGLAALIAGVLLTMRGNGEAGSRRRRKDDDVDGGWSALTDEVPAVSTRRTEDPMVAAHGPAPDEVQRR
jgi:hypothetical protein